MAKPYLTLHLDHFEDERRLAQVAHPEVLVAELALLLASKRLESDGRLAPLQVRRTLLGLVDDVEETMKRLDDARLAVREPDGSVLLSDWRSFMKSREEIEAYRAQQAAFGRAGAAVTNRARPRQPRRGPSRGSPGQPSEQPSGLQNGVASSPDLTGPDLTGPDLTGPDLSVDFEDDESSSSPTRGGGLAEAILNPEAARWAGNAGG